MSEEPQQEIHIDVDRLHFIANTGVNRAAVFMGLGLNAAHDENFNAYRLSDLDVDTTSIAPDFVPRNASQEVIQEYKQEFATWITGCGLREVLEHFGLMLDEMHHFALFIANIRKPDLLDQHPEKLHKAFHAMPSIPAKLKLLDERFGITCKHNQEIGSLYRVRNSLTHGLGYVRQRDLDAGAAQLTLRWLAMDLIAEGAETGTKLPVKNLIGQVTTEAMTVKAVFNQRELVLAVGQKITLTESNLWEICLFVRTYCIPSIIQSFLDFAKQLGVMIQDNSNAPK